RRLQTKLKNLQKTFHKSEVFPSPWKFKSKMRETTIIIIHLVYWYRLMACLVLRSVNTSTTSAVVKVAMWSNFTTQLVMLFPFYTAYFFLFPKFLVRKKYLGFVLLAVLAVVCTMLLTELSIISFKRAFVDTLPVVHKYQFLQERMDRFIL